MAIYGGVLKRILLNVKDEIGKLDYDELTNKCSVNDEIFERDLVYLEDLGASEKLLEELCTLYVSNTLSASMLTADIFAKIIESELCQFEADPVTGILGLEQ